MGLKLRWFRARVSFVGSSSKDSETVTGVGFKQVNSSEFPTYTSISEFAPSNNQSYARQTQARKEQNEEVALKVRSMLNRSLSNVQASKELSTSKSCENISTINHESEPQIISNTLPNPKTLAPKPILKKHEEIEVRKESEEEVVLRNGHSRSVENLQERPRAVLLPDNVSIESCSEEMPVDVGSQNDLDSIPPPVNYATLPTSEPRSILKQWDDINPTEDEFINELENNYSEIEDKPYVIGLQEGSELPEYAEVHKERKQKKSISFDDQVETINDNDSDLYANIMDTMDQRARSSTSSMSSSNNPTSEDDETDREKDLYSKDYTNTKRTSYFQAGNSTYSSQAASIFFGNKKPVAERRPTQYINHVPDEDTDSQTSA